MGKKVAPKMAKKLKLTAQVKPARNFWKAPKNRKTRQQVVELVRHALQYGVEMGVLARHGQFYRFTGRSPMWPMTPTRPMGGAPVPSISSDEDTVDESVASGIDSIPYDNKWDMLIVDRPKPKPLSIEKALTLKIDKFFNSTREISNPPLTDFFDSDTSISGSAHYSNCFRAQDVYSDIDNDTTTMS